MLADVAAGVLGRLEDRLGTRALRTWQIDLGRPDGAIPAAMLGRFDFAFTLDMFQFIADPLLCLRRFGELLRPGKELLLTFPNQVSRRAGHVCWFERSEDLAALLRSAGFAREEVFAITMRGWARAAYSAGHEVPLTLLRRLRRPGTPVTGVYDESWASHQSDASPKFMRWLIHAWWGALARVMALGGPRFETERIAGPALGHRLVARAWKA